MEVAPPPRRMEAVGSINGSGDGENASGNGNDTSGAAPRCMKYH